MPDAALAPLQPPVAVQLVALVAVQLSVLAPPRVTVLGDADSATVGADTVVTVTLTDCVALPPAPVHVSANAESAAIGPVLALPAVALVPLQLPEATQLLASVDDQVSVADEPVATDDGATASVTVGALGITGGCSTPTVTVWPAVPPAPAQVSEYEVVDASAPVASLPASALLPLHPPDATQFAASVDDHASLDDEACWIVSGDAVKTTVGTT